MVAGLLFLSDPTGKKMGMSVSYLSTSPFTNFLIPGITLFIINGLMSGFAAIASIKKSKGFPYLIMLQGLLLSGWIIIQVLMVRNMNVLHFVMLAIGLTLFTLGIILKNQRGTLIENMSTETNSDTG